jgi:LPS-assembly protein
VYFVTVRKPTLLPLLAASIVVWLPVVAAAENVDPMWGLCVSPSPPASPAENSSVPAADAPAYLSADYGEGKLNDIYTLKGHVSIKRGPQSMSADKAVYDDNSGMVDATGNVRFQQGGLITEGAAAHFNLNTGTGEFDAARYQFLEQHASGRADAVIRESSDVTKLHHATYTTCDPNKVDWELRARDITLHHDEAVGEAYNVTLRFKDVPFFYFPYVNFPLSDQRKTGVLAPTLGYSHSTRLDVAVPFYWNIAPNRDATITPRLIETRGLLTKGDFRYLTQDSTGEIRAGYLPDDKVYGAGRGDLSIQHKTQLDPHWNTNIDASYASDYRYLADLGNSLATASTTQLERRMDVNYGGNYTSFLARVQGYQVLDPTLAVSARPYERLPQLVFATATPTHPFGVTYRIDGEYVRFERESSLTGTRLNLTPSLAWPLETQGYFFTPKISVNHTQYQLSGEAPGLADDPSRTVPMYSIDTGLYLERETSIAKHSFLQTLEPRLYYLRVPYRDQSNLPLFDTGTYDFSFSQLFRDNRFSGADRIGDADQLSVAVTSRLLDENSGREWLSGSLGQIIYMRDRQVTLGIPPQTRQTSDFVAEATTHFSEHWSSNLDLQSNPDRQQVDQGDIQIQYHLDDRRIFNAGYRFLGSQIDNPSLPPLNQTDISFLWRLNPHWQAVGRWNYSLRDRISLETLAGIQYESCCWTLSAISRRYVSSISGDSSQSFYIQMDLKGLTNIGNSVEDILKNDILGYRTEYK